MDHSWLGVLKTADPSIWELPVSHGTTGARGELFGGCVIGAAVSLLEERTDRPVIWATSQFVDSGRPTDTVRLEAQLVTEGHRLTQARVKATVDDRDQSFILAALGSRNLADELSSVSIPDVPEPSLCEPIIIDPGIGGFRPRVEVRVAEPRNGTSRATTKAWWFRFDGTTAGDPCSIALAADNFPQALNSALGRPVYGTSLDNTIRFIRNTVCDWLLIDSNVDVIHDGIGHGTTYIWSEQKELLAIASQTCGISEIKP